MGECVLRSRASAPGWPGLIKQCCHLIFPLKTLLCTPAQRRGLPGLPGPLVQITHTQIKRSPFNDGAQAAAAQDRTLRKAAMCRRTLSEICSADLLRP